MGGHLVDDKADIGRSRAGTPLVLAVGLAEGEGRDSYEHADQAAIDRRHLPGVGFRQLQRIFGTSGLGWLLATVLMIVGISFIALLSAATAARLVELDSEEGQEELLQGIRGAGRRESK